MYGCTKFHQYVYGKKVRVQTDHKPLEALFRKPLFQAPQRLQRMMLRLQRYDLQVEYEPGKNLYIADTLSRAPEGQNETAANSKDEFEVLIIENMPDSEEKLEQFKQETRKDPTLQKLESGSRYGDVKNVLISARTKFAISSKSMAESLLKYVTKRRNRSSDSSTDGKVDSPAMKKVNSTSDPESSPPRDEHGEHNEDSDLVLTALELTDDLSGTLKCILEKLKNLDTIECTVKKIEGSLDKLKKEQRNLKSLRRRPEKTSIT